MKKPTKKQINDMYQELYNPTTDNNYFKAKINYSDWFLKGWLNDESGKHSDKLCRPIKRRKSAKKKRKSAKKKRKSTKKKRKSAKKKRKSAKKKRKSTKRRKFRIESDASLTNLCKRYKNSNITGLFHNTSIENAISIIANGWLYSPYDLKRQGVDFTPGFTTGDWDMGGQFTGVYTSPILKTNAGKSIEYFDPLIFVFSVVLLEQNNYHINTEDSNGYISKFFIWV